MNVRIAILQGGAEPSAAELGLQEKLGCPLYPSGEKEEASADAEFILCWQGESLYLYSTARNAPGGLSVDLTAPALQSRALDGLKGQGLGKAVGLKSRPLPSVLDATAGLGSDAYLLARAGCKVQLLERSPIVHALLVNALERARADLPEIAAAVARMNLVHADFLDYPVPASSVDVVYLDPMFPADRKSAKSGKGMYLLQELLGYDCDEGALLSKARTVASKRVVVKRARLSPQLAGEKPDICFRGSSSRFDVYLKL